MSRTHYTATFPAASPGDQATWPNTVKVYPDANTQVPLGSVYLDESRSLSVYSDAASVALTVGTETLTVTIGSPSATGASPAPTGGSSPVSRWNGNGASSLSVPNDGAYHVIHNWVENSSAGTDIVLAPSTGIFTFAAGLYLFMAAASPVLPSDATHLIIDWRNSSGIIAGDFGLGQGALPILAKDNTVPADCNAGWWLEFSAGGTVSVALQTIGATAALDCGTALDIRRIL